LIVPASGGRFALRSGKNAPALLVEASATRVLPRSLPRS
jgi:hypothetical protein